MRRVVVTGAGVLSPIGSSIPAFLQGLREAAMGVGPIASFDAEAFETRIAGEVRGLDRGGVDLDGHPQAAALRRDPKSLFGLVAAREALASAAGDTPLTAHYPARRVGVMVASGLEIFHLEDLLDCLSDGAILGSRLLAAMEAAPAGARLQIPAHLGALCIARELGARGPFSVNVSACAAGTQALGEAFREIRAGHADAVLAGGYDSMVNPLGVGGFTLLGVLSRSNHLGGRASRPFDACRDGFVLGEGAAMVLMEEYEAARARGAPIRAEVLGFGSTLDAHRLTDPAPGHGGAALAMQAALAEAELEPGAVDYINAHGTGTPKNDPAETAAIHAVFGRHARRIPVSSTKSQIGHLIGAAGAVEFVASLLALEHGFLPATINLTSPDPQCDLDFVPGSPRPARIRRFISNSFGFGGQNAVIAAGSPP